MFTHTFMAAFKISVKWKCIFTKGTKLMSSSTPAPKSSNTIKFQGEEKPGTVSSQIWTFYSYLCKRKFREEVYISSNLITCVAG